MRSRRVPTVPPLTITDAERAELQRRVRAHTTPQRAAKRARIVLLAADGVPNRQIAPMVGRNQHTVAQWRRRFAVERLAGLTDRTRPGRSLVYGALLSLDDFGSRVGRRSGCHPVYGEGRGVR
jgi:Homeodomain-like domain